MRKFIYLLLIGAFFAVLLLPALSMAEEKTPPQTLEELEEKILEVLSETNTPGASVVLTTADEVLWIGAMGKADVENDLPVTEETMFRVGSVSKSFVGLTMIKLEEKGLLSLDDELDDLAPGLSSNPWQETNPIRLSHLLEHTAGFDDMSLREYTISAPDITLEDAMKINPGTREVRWPPGKHVSYSNAGASVAAYAAEKAVGMPFEEIVHGEIFEPLGMDTASFFLTPTADEKLTKSYGPDGSFGCVLY